MTHIETLSGVTAETKGYVVCLAIIVLIKADLIDPPPGPFLSGYIWQPGVLPSCSTIVRCEGIVCSRARAAVRGEVCQ